VLRYLPQMPTAVPIAERAGNSVRSIFERFPDLNALRVAATDYGLAQALALAPPRHVDADRQTRLRSQVETRAHTCERGVALWRVLLANQEESDELKLRVSRARQTTVTRLELMYRPDCPRCRRSANSPDRARGATDIEAEGAITWAVV
jgi:hypothetical protein